jgi:hypothetical protein
MKKQSKKSRREQERHKRKTYVFRHDHGGGKYDPDFTHYYGWQVDLKFMISEVDIPDISFPIANNNFIPAPDWMYKENNRTSFTFNGTLFNPQSGPQAFQSKIFQGNTDKVISNKNDQNFINLIRFLEANPNWAAQIIISTPWLRNPQLNGQFGPNVNVLAQRPTKLRRYLRILIGGPLPTNLSISMQWGGNFGEFINPIRLN